MFSLAALGGATMPWLVGFMSQRANNLRVGLLVPLAGCFAMIILVAALRRRDEEGASQAMYNHIDQIADLQVHAHKGPNPSTK